MVIRAPDGGAPAVSGVPITEVESADKGGGSGDCPVGSGSSDGPPEVVGVSDIDVAPLGRGAPTLLRMAVSVHPNSLRTSPGQRDLLVGYGTVLEAVPNVSEGRSASLIAEIGRAFAAGVRLLDVHSDPDHHRSVFTLAGEDDELESSLVAGVARACELIDLRRHHGVHPRVGAADVVPVVPLEAGGMERAKATALATAAAIGRELGVPVFLYGELAGGKRPAFFRRGGLAELRRRVAEGELAPEYGPRELDPRSGAVLVGARAPLVAYNVDLATGGVPAARSIAAAVRESSGGMPGVQAIGLRLPRSRRVQVSMNALDLDRSPLHAVVDRVQAEAQARGVEVEGGELVGLVPERVLAEARAAGKEVPGVDEAHVLERLLGL